MWEITFSSEQQRNYAGFKFHYSLSHQISDFGESEWIHFTGSGYLLRTDAWSYPVLRLKRLGLSKMFRRLVVTLIRRYGVSLIHLDASAECLPGLPTFNW